MEIEGYKLCACGNLELEHVFYATPGVCFECFRKGTLARIQSIEVINRARRVDIPVPSPHKKKPKKNRNRARKADHARRKAMRRTKNACIDIYELFYADERMKMGLPPTPRREAGWYKRVVETYGAAQDYPAAVDTGAPDGSQGA